MRSQWFAEHFGQGCDLSRLGQSATPSQIKHHEIQCTGRKQIPERQHAAEGFEASWPNSKR
jgi:hypothetical protein